MLLQFLTKMSKQRISMSLGLHESDYGYSDEDDSYSDEKGNNNYAPSAPPNHCNNNYA